MTTTDSEIYIKNNDVQSDTQEQAKIDQLMKTEGRVLCHIKSVFPMQMFPDELIVDTNKVTFVHKFFFFTKTVFPILIENINGVRIASGPLFASVTVEISGFETNPPPLQALWVSDAVKARSYILGLITAREQNLELDKLSHAELVQKLQYLGETRGAENPEYAI